MGDHALLDGTTPLQIAAFKGHLEVVCVLCDHGADQAKQDGTTSLYMAAQEGHLDVVLLVRERGREGRGDAGWCDFLAHRVPERALGGGTPLVRARGRCGQGESEWHDSLGTLCGLRPFPCCR